MNAASQRPIANRQFSRLDCESSQPPNLDPHFHNSLSSALLTQLKSLFLDRTVRTVRTIGDETVKSQPKNSPSQHRVVRSQPHSRTTP